MKRNAHVLASLLLPFAAACGGSGSVTVQNGGGSRLELTLLEAPADPLPLLGAARIAWRANRRVDYAIERRGAAGDTALASGSAEAGETIALEVSGAQLGMEGASTISLSASDDFGSQASSDATVELGPIERFPLGLGLHDGLAYDATRNELLVSNSQTGYVQFVDVDASSPGYGSVVAILPPGPDVGPIAVAITGDGRKGFELERSTLLSFDLETLHFDDNQYLAGGFPPTSLAVAPDASRLYVGYAHTLLFRSIVDSSPPPPLASVGLFDGRIDGGDVALTPSGKLVLYAWAGGPNRALWILDGDDASPSFHELLSERFFLEPPIPEPFAPPMPRLAVTPSGSAAYVGNLAGVFRVALDEPDFPVSASRSDLAFTGVAAVEVDGGEFALLTGPQGTLTVLDPELDVLGTLFIDGELADRYALDPVGERLFLVSVTSMSSGTLIVLPLR